MSMQTAVQRRLPHLITPLPGPNARSIIERDAKIMSPSYTRGYPFVMARGEGAIVEDVDHLKPEGRAPLRYLEAIMGAEVDASARGNEHEIVGRRRRPAAMHDARI